MTSNRILLLISFFLTEFGRSMYFILVTWLLYTLTGDPLYTGLFISLGFLPGFILNLFFGVLVDRRDRKSLALIANLTAVSSLLAATVLTQFQLINPWILITVHMILQTSGSLFRPAIQAFMAEAFPKAELPAVFSQTGSAAIAGGLIGAATGGILSSLLSLPISMLIATCCFGLALATLTQIKQISKSSLTKTTESPLKGLTDGFSYFKNNTYLFSLFSLMFTGQLVFHSTIGFMSVYTIEHLKQPIIVYGWLDATLACGGLIAGLLGGWWWKQTRLFTFYSLVFVLLGLILLATTTMLTTAFLGVFLIGLGTTWVRVLLQSVQQMVTDPNYHGRMASYRMICNQGAVIVSGPILGLTAANLGVNYIFLALALPVLAVSGLAYKQIKQVWFKEVNNHYTG